MIDNLQTRGTTFPITFKTRKEQSELDALFDTGATRSCINYDTYNKLKLNNLKTSYTPTVVGADGSSLGAVGTARCELSLGGVMIEQEFIVCNHLKRNVIIGIDCAKKCCLGIRWTAEGTRVLSVKEKDVIEIQETKRGTPLTVTTNVKIPARHGGVFEVKAHGKMKGTQVITPHPEFFKDYPTVYAHELSVKMEEIEAENPIYIMHVTNVSQGTNLYLRKGQVVGFAQPESESVDYIETVTEKTLDDIIDGAPRNWIPASREIRRQDEFIKWYNAMMQPCKQTDGQPSMKQNNESNVEKTHQTETTDGSPSMKDERQEIIQEAVDSDFLISPGDIYPNRKVILEDADIKTETRKAFEEICLKYDAAFSKNNKDIGKTQLIEMDIDTGNSPPIAQSPYTLPLKHYEWVQREIETLEKAGVIVKSLSPWASPVIVVPKKSAPDEPPRRRLCVDYRRLNALQQEVRTTEKGTGCLSLYPLPKIDEMLAKLRGAKVFSTIDLRSGYYHIGLTEASRPKSAFVVPMGKWEFLRTPFGLSQAPAHFQLLIDNVLAGYSAFAMGYLDDIIIYSENEADHLIHLEKIFQRLEKFSLKMKREKCAFFKRNIQYLGHIVSEEGFEPLPEKLESIRNMPAPRNQKEIKQFLGLIGYYRKFVPRFSDLARPLTLLTRHDAEFKWTTKCQRCFDLMREMLMKYPILRYPDTTKGYTLFTDASKMGWAGVLTQAHEDENGRSKQHPVCYVSGLFRGSQINWAALTKEAYAIYMAVKKLTFYLMGSQTTIKTDHRPLKKFLEKTTLNAKVNNWAVELEQFRLKIDWIMGRKNTLADTLSRLLVINPDIQPEPEIEGQEFGVPCFEELEPAKTFSAYSEEVGNISIEEDGLGEVKLPLTPHQISKLQQADLECREIVKKRLMNDQTAKIYLKNGPVLTRLWNDEDNTYNCVVLPKCLRIPLTTLAHDFNGHNGGRRTYSALKRNYYWPGMKRDIFHHCRACLICNKYNQTTKETQFSHFTAPEGPMQFICMDLVGPIDPVSSAGNRFCLTVIDMLTGFVMATPIPDKKAETICNAYRNTVYCTFGGSSRILTDNGTEFKNKLMDEICERLGVKHIYSPVYTPQANGKLEGFHRFFKACIGKHVRGNEIEWDQVVPLAASAYNFFPCASSRESPFFLMFGRDPIAPFNSLLEPLPKYYGQRGGHLEMDALQRMYQVTAHNLKQAREKESDPEERRQKFKVGDLVLTKDINTNVFDPKFTPDFRVVAIYGPNNIKVKDAAGKTQVRRAAHLKLMDPVDRVISQLPAKETFEKFGRNCKVQLPVKNIPDLQITLPKPQLEGKLDGYPSEISKETGESANHTGSSELESAIDGYPSVTEHRDVKRPLETEKTTTIEGEQTVDPHVSENQLHTTTSEKLRKTNIDDPHAELQTTQVEVAGVEIKGESRSLWGKLCSFSKILLTESLYDTDQTETDTEVAAPWVTGINFM